MVHFYNHLLIIAALLCCGLKSKWLELHIYSMPYWFGIIGASGLLKVPFCCIGIDQIKGGLMSPLTGQIGYWHGHLIYNDTAHIWWCSFTLLPLAEIGAPYTPCKQSNRQPQTKTVAKRLLFFLSILFFFFFKKNILRSVILWYY